LKELDKVDPALATLDRFYKEEAAYLAAGGGDFSAIAATLDPECVIFQPASLPYGGEWRGHAGFEAWMKAFVQQWSSMEVQNTELFPHGDVIISKSHVYARSRVSGQVSIGPSCSSSSCEILKSWNSGLSIGTLLQSFPICGVASTCDRSSSRQRLTAKSQSCAFSLPGVYSITAYSPGAKASFGQIL